MDSANCFAFLMLIIAAISILPSAAIAQSMGEGSDGNEYLPMGDGGGPKGKCSAGEKLSFVNQWCCQDRTCAQVLSGQTHICTKFCMKPPGCVCADGLVREFDGGPCIPSSHCCPVNEQWSVCGTDCDKKCPGHTNICPLICRETGGCVCQPGFVRSPVPGVGCILPQQCPPIQID